MKVAAGHLRLFTLFQLNLLHVCGEDNITGEEDHINVLNSLEEEQDRKWVMANFSIWSWPIYIICTVFFHLPLGLNDNIVIFSDQT